MLFPGVPLFHVPVVIRCLRFVVFANILIRFPEANDGGDREHISQWNMCCPRRLGGQEAHLGESASRRLNPQCPMERDSLIISRVYICRQQAILRDPTRLVPILDHFLDLLDWWRIRPRLAAVPITGWKFALCHVLPSLMSTMGSRRGRQRRLNKIQAIIYKTIMLRKDGHRNIPTIRLMKS